MEAEALLKGGILCKDPLIRNVTAVSVGQCSLRKMCRIGEVGSSVRLLAVGTLIPSECKGCCITGWTPCLKHAPRMCSEHGKYAIPALEW